MHRILFRLGSLSFYSYSVFIVLGILGGLTLACYEGKRQLNDAKVILDAAFYAILAGVIGGRLYHVGLNWAYYSARQEEILALRGGGVAWQGAFLGGGIALLIYAWLRECSFWALADAAAPGLALAGGLGWLGALLHGSNYGMVYAGFLSQDLPDIYGLSAPRFPTQGVASAFNWAILVGLLLLARRRPFPGVLALSYLIVHSLGLFLLEFTRADDTLYIGVFRFNQVLYLAEFLGGLLLFVFMWRRRDRVNRT
ncbi:MAG: prolipoprotein diacylglyceryl transferase [Anaerolineae bacterium]